MKFLTSLVVLALAVVTACKPKPPVDSSQDASSKLLNVVATTGMIADMASQIAGDKAQVTTLMGPGVDPHLYKATAGDVAALQTADVILYNGLFLEGRMAELLREISGSGRITVALGEKLPSESVLHPDGGTGHADPHIWHDVSLWAQCIPHVQEALSHARPEYAQEFKTRAEDLQRRYQELDQWVHAEIQSIPETRRVLVTSHDAYEYFGRAYGLQVVGLQGISTATEAGLADMAKLADFIRERGVPAIFVESSVPQGAIQQLSRETGAKVGGELYSDALGTPGEVKGGYDPGTYDGMIRHNVITIVSALR
jgi:manganese/zinc/iron transport system substrate-binding protein